MPRLIHWWKKIVRNSEKLLGHSYLVKMDFEIDYCMLQGGSSLNSIIYLCAKFQHSSMIRSVSRTPQFLKSYLEDIDGSWLEP